MARYRTEGEGGPHDRSNRPGSYPSQISSDPIGEIDSLRRQKKWSARRIHHHLQGLGYQLHLCTVGRWLHGLGISRLRDLTPDGENLRLAAQRIRAGCPGHMVHLDVKKLGRIPHGGGWWAHRRGSTAAKATKREPGAGIGYTYLHSAVDGFSLLAHTEVLDDEKAVTTTGFFSRARAFFAVHGITHIHWMVTDNGANHRAKDFTRTVNRLADRHQRIRPYTPRHNGKGERYNQIRADEVLYARPCASEQARRKAIGVWVNHFNHPRHHTAHSNQSPASRTPPESVTSLLPRTSSIANGTAQPAALETVLTKPARVNKIMPPLQKGHEHP